MNPINHNTFPYCNYFLISSYLHNNLRVVWNFDQYAIIFTDTHILFSNN